MNERMKILFIVTMLHWCSMKKGESKGAQAIFEIEPRTNSRDVLRPFWIIRLISEISDLLMSSPHHSPKKSTW